MIPAPVVERVGRFWVVRDDLIPGGTKRRVIDVLLVGADEFVYASPAYGYAQVALAYACRDLGLQATVFTAQRAKPHARTLEAKNAGAKVVMVPTGYLSNVQSKARAYCELTGAVMMPFGLDTPGVRDALAAVARGLDIEPSQVWAAAGSGMLIRSLQAAWPEAEFSAVQVGKAPNIGMARSYVAPEPFEKDARSKPPFPSCSNYDAKVWQFMNHKAATDALFWNVAA